MADVPVAPFLLRDVQFALGDDSYQAALSQVEFVPTTAAVTWTGLANNTVTFPTTATWGCTIAYAQDWGTPNSFSQFLLDHEGESFEATFTPASGQGTFTATITVTPGSIGGTAGAVGVGTVTLGSTKPAFTPFVPPDGAAMVAVAADAPATSSTASKSK